MHDSDTEQEQSLLAAAALGSLDPTDLAALEQVLTRSSTARSELDQLREVVALLPYAAPPVTPPAHVRASLMERIAADQAARQPLQSAPLPRRASRSMSVWLLSLTVIIVLLGWFTFTLQQQVIATLVITAPREVNAFTEVMVTVEPVTNPTPDAVEVILTGTL